jgi:endonuclease/exonuclease/phosphatase family metal-dependent hydrolase
MRHIWAGRFTEGLREWLEKLSRGVIQKLMVTLIALVGIGDRHATASDARAAGIWFGSELTPAKHLGTVRLATYNVENLFDSVDDPMLSGQYDDLPMATSAARLKALSDAIHKLDADVLCLQEVESESCLRWFRDTYLADMGYQWIASKDAGYYRGVEQSVLSRIQITSADVLTGEDYGIRDMDSRRTPQRAGELQGEWTPCSGGPCAEHFQRAPLFVTLKTESGYELSVIVCHFKAGGFAAQRELEALRIEAVAEQLLGKNPGLNLAVVGDFNALPNAMSVKVLRSGTAVPVSAFNFRFDKDAPRTTYTTHSSGRALDYILCSRGLAADCVPGSYFVLGTLHPPSNWDYRKAAEIPAPDGYASDHYPVALEIVTTSDMPPLIEATADRSPGAAAVPNDAKTPTEPSGAKPVNTAKQEPISQQPRSLRPLAADCAKDEELLESRALIAAGWEYIMPRPKSAKAGWGVTDKRTTWWRGYWENKSLNIRCSDKPLPDRPAHNEGAGAGGAHAGGSPDAPTTVEWLCSTTGGIEPACQKAKDK